MNKKPIHLAIVLCLLVIAAVTIKLQESTITIVDGDTTLTVKTNMKTVGDVLSKFDLEYESVDRVIPEPTSAIVDGDSITITRAPVVTVKYNDSMYSIRTLEKDTSKILEMLALEVDEDDFIAQTGLDDDAVAPKISVSKVETLTKVDQVETSYKTLYVLKDEMDYDDQKVVQKGMTGRSTRRTDEYSINEKVEVISVGMDVVQPPTESIVQRGYNKYLVLDNGEYFKYSKSYLMQSSAYDLSYESCGKLPDHPLYGITYSGTRARPGVVAVDPRTISLGSSLYVKSLDYFNDYGFASAEDTGSAIKGNKIDLFISDNSRALKYGRRNVRVYVLENDVDEDKLEGYQNKELW